MDKRFQIESTTETGHDAHIALSSAAGLNRRFRKTCLANRRRALTLLELLLALALMSLLMAAISMAINLHLRALEARRADVEEARLARAVLRLIAQDIRGAVQPRPIDLTGFPDISQILGDEIQQLLGGASSNADQADSNEDENALAPLEEVAALETIAPVDSGLATDAGSDADADETIDIATSAVPADVPGVYGTQFELQVDVSRLPRADEYAAQMVDELAVTDLATDVKSVAYYVAEGEVDSAQNGDLANDQTGLVRREVDRRVTLWAATNGDSLSLAEQEQIIAPEIVTVEFQYFDGMEWYTEWDSEASSSVPVAIDITIGMMPMRQATTFGSVSPSTTTELDDDLHYYNMVVYLPISERASEETVECCCAF